MYDSGVSVPNCYDLRASALPPDQVGEVVARLLEGAIIIYPTDTLYAVGCRALDGLAVRRLREAKGREANKPLPVIAADLAQARSLAARWPLGAKLLAEAFWPGPLTLVVPARPGLPFELLAGAPSVAVRVPDSKVARVLAQSVGPLVATSANLAGEAPCPTAGQALRAFPSASLALDVGELKGVASTLVLLTAETRGFEILRNGPVTRLMIEEALEGGRAESGEGQP